MIQSIVKPNFFIVGAPKCGTTALSDYLRTHPHIYVSNPKEPHYFAEDFEQYRLVKSLEEYLGLFQDCQPNNRLVGEASVFYLYSSVALKNIYKFNPQAKIIVMLRNPVELVYSFHSQLLYTADENEKNFEKAWHLQSLRERGNKIPRLCREPSLLQYAAIGKLGEQIDKLLTIFPPEQIKIIWFEDFVKSTDEVYESILNFLEVPIDQKTDFQPINQNKVHRLEWLGKFTAKPPVYLTKLAMKAKKFLGIERLGIIEQMRSVNTQKNPRKTLDKNFHLELVEEFREDIKKLSQLHNRDLSHWLI